MALQTKDKGYGVLAEGLPVVDPFVCKAMKVRLMTQSSTKKRYRVKVSS